MLWGLFWAFGSSAPLGFFVCWLCGRLLLLWVLVVFKATRWFERGQKWPKGGLTQIEGDALSIVRLPHPVT